MSSIISYESDNLTIIASKWNLIGSSIEWSHDIPTVRLHISVLMNGKIKNLFYEFIVEIKNSCEQTAQSTSWETVPVSDEKIASLKDWTAWYTVLETLHQLWYSPDMTHWGMYSILSSLYK